MFYVQVALLGIIFGCYYALSATGIVVTYQATGVFNIAHFAIALLAGYLGWQLSGVMGPAARPRRADRAAACAGPVSVSCSNASCSVRCNSARRRARRSSSPRSASPSRCSRLINVRVGPGRAGQQHRTGAAPVRACTPSASARSPSTPSRSASSSRPRASPALLYLLFQRTFLGDVDPRRRRPARARRAGGHRRQPRARRWRGRSAARSPRITGLIIAQGTLEPTKIIFFGIETFSVAVVARLTSVPKAIAYGFSSWDCGKQLLRRVPSLRRRRQAGPRPTPPSSSTCRASCCSSRSSCSVASTKSARPRRPAPASSQGNLGRPAPDAQRRRSSPSSPASARRRLAVRPRLRRPAPRAGRAGADRDLHVDRVHHRLLRPPHARPGVDRRPRRVLHRARRQRAATCRCWSRCSFGAAGRARRRPAGGLPGAAAQGPVPRTHHARPRAHHRPLRVQRPHVQGRTRRAHGRAPDAVRPRPQRRPRLLLLRTRRRRACASCWPATCAADASAACSRRCATRRPPRSRSASTCDGPSCSCSACRRPWPASAARCSTQAEQNWDTDTFNPVLGLFWFIAVVVCGISSLGGGVLAAVLYVADPAPARPRHPKRHRAVRPRRRVPRPPAGRTRSRSRPASRRGSAVGSAEAAAASQAPPPDAANRCRCRPPSPTKILPSEAARVDDRVRAARR